MPPPKVKKPVTKKSQEKKISDSKEPDQPKEVPDPIEEEEKILKPEPMKHGKISRKNFSFKGPITMETKLKGEVRHAKEGAQTGSFKEPIQFDDNLNQVWEIGTEVEKMEPTGGTTLMTGTEGDNTLRAPSKIEEPKPFPIPKRPTNGLDMLRRIPSRKKQIRMEDYTKIK